MAIGTTAAILGGALAPVVGGAIGGAAASGDRSKALELQKQALQTILNVNTPDIEQLKLALQQYQSAGELNPEMQAVINAQDSLMGNISTDPRLRDAQLKALGQMQQLGVSGMRPEDEAALARVINAGNREENARQQAILQNMQQRGIGGSGLELAAKLSSSQAAANRASQQGLDIAAQASQRALEAIMKSGSLGGQIREQDFSQEAQKAQAQDVINRYNAMNQQQVSNTNVTNRNAAQAQNLANKQSLMNMNTQLSNQQQQYNKNLYQQQFENDLRKAAAAAGGQRDMANTYQQQGDRTAQMWSGIGSGLGQAAGAYGNYEQQQARDAKQDAFNQQYLDILKGK
jgi:hypothetical protein